MFTALGIQWKMVAWEVASPCAGLFSLPVAPSVPALVLHSPTPCILLPFFLPPIDRLPVGLFFPRCCSVQFSQVEEAWVCSPNLL